MQVSMTKGRKGLASLHGLIMMAVSRESGSPDAWKAYGSGEWQKQKRGEDMFCSI